jgi:hypothetical protein
VANRVDFNAMVREAAGRGPASEREQPVVEPPAGNAIGRGRVIPRPPRARADNRAMNDLLRAGALIARTATVAGGVDLGSLDLHPFRRR